MLYDEVGRSEDRRRKNLSDSSQCLVLFSLQVWCSTTEPKLADTLWTFLKQWRPVALLAPPSLHPNSSGLLLRTALTSATLAGSLTSQSGGCPFLFLLGTLLIVDVDLDGYLSA